MNKKDKLLLERAYCSMYNEGLADRVKAKVAGGRAMAKQLGTAAKTAGSAVKGAVTGEGPEFKQGLRNAADQASQATQVGGDAKFNQRIQNFINQAKKELAAFEKNIAVDIQQDPSIQETIDPIKQELNNVINGLQELLTG